MRCYIFLYNCVELILYESRIQFVRHQESFVFFYDAFEFCQEQIFIFKSIIYPGPVFNIVYSVCPENLSKVLNTEQLKVEQDKMRLEKCPVCPLTQPERQKRKRQKVDMAELAEVKPTSLHLLLHILSSHFGQKRSHHGYNNPFTNTDTTQMLFEIALCVVKL